MSNFSVVAVYDRKKVAETKGISTVEIRITLSRAERRYFKYTECSPKEWTKILNSDKLKCEIERYEEIIRSMIVLKEEMTIENLNLHLGINKDSSYERVRLNSNFINWMTDQIKDQKLRPNTIRTKNVAVKALIDFGRIKKFSDLTPANIYAFDDWLRANGGEKADITVRCYHKRIHPYVKKAYRMGIIEYDPYDRCELKTGKSKPKKPLTEDELLVIRKMKLSQKLDKVRDLFIFAAYTGLAYCDVMNFNFNTMTEKHGEMYYIDGERIKSGSDFFTPILPPAMEILKKYNYNLPVISNQKVNDYLHVLEARAGFNKPLTFHIARHSFGTLALAHDIPLDKVQRMMGHKNIRTTQLYAKVLKTTLISHANNFAEGLFN